MTELSDREIGEGMLKVLDERGWHQGSFWDNTQPTETASVCLSGAVRCVLWGQPNRSIHDFHSEKWNQFANCLSRLRNQLEKDNEVASVAAWNDSSHRTEEDVRLLIKRTFFE